MKAAVSIKSFIVSAAVLAAGTLFAGPKITVIGDSISTYSGYSIYAHHYQNGSYGQFTSVDQTWWMVFAHEVGGTLSCNAAWTGTCVAGTGDSPMSSAYRLNTERLGEPDIFLICAGTNDARVDPPMALGEYQYDDLANADLTKFRPAFARMLDFYRANYPQADIVVVVNTDIDTLFGITDEQWEPYAASMETIAAHYGAISVRVHDVEKVVESWAQSSSGNVNVHPTVAGMATMGRQVAAAYRAAKSEPVNPSEVASWVTSDDASARIYRTGEDYAFVFTNTAAAATLTLHDNVFVRRALVVGGGGSGGGNCGGGGGAGGVLDLDWCDAPKTLSANNTLVATVGAGGARVTDNGVGRNGGESSLALGVKSYVAPGGGGGGTYGSVNGLAGGCGGGSAQGSGVGATTMDTSDPAVHGTAGGAGVNNGGYYYGGGGGGAGQAGVATSGRNSGKGGDGYACDITGVWIAYAGGGGGGACASQGGSAGAGGAGGGGAGASGATADPANTTGFPGTDGLGGGGGGANGGVGSPVSGAGGSGCVIVLLRPSDTSKTDIDIPTCLANVTVQYDGTSKKPAVSETDDYTVEFSSGDWTTVGSYTVTLSLKDKTTTQWSGLGDSGDLAYTTVIERKVVEIPSLPASETVFICDGSAHRPAVVTTDDIVVTATEGDWREVGTYRLNLALSETQNRVWSDGTDDSFDFVYFVQPAHTSREGTVVEGTRRQTAWGETYQLKDGSDVYQIVRVTATGEDVAWTIPANTYVEYLLVGGGGSGGYSNANGDNSYNPGGGGAGAVIYDFLTLDAETELTLRVGAGGASADTPSTAGHAGEATTLAYGGDVRRCAPGGGGGSYGDGWNPDAGESSVGSGGGGHAGSSYHSPGGKHLLGDGLSLGAIGHDGAPGGRDYLAGGGGGAGGPGGEGGGDNLCNGGAGLALFITGQETVYAAGGAAEYGEGGSHNVGGRAPRSANGWPTPIEPTPNTGSGGYAGARDQQASGAGASGVIVLRYAVKADGISLQVCATVAEIGAVEPAYGLYQDVKNLPIACSAPATATDALHAYTNCGYRIGQMVNGVMAYGELVPSLLFSFDETTPGTYSVQWNWAYAGHRLTIEDERAEYGSVTVTGECVEGDCYRADAALTLTVAGDAFSYWVGDVPAGHENDNPLELTMDAPKTVRPVYRSLWVYDESAGTLSDGYWTFPVSGERTAITVGTPFEPGLMSDIDFTKGVKDGGAIVALAYIWLRAASKEIRDYVTEVRLPDEMTTVPGQAFRDCNGIRKVVLPRRVSSIEAGVFADSPNLETVEPETFAGSLTNLGTHAFRNCSSLKCAVKLTSRKLFLEDYGSYEYSTFFGSGIESADLSQSRVERTPLGFLRNCKNLKSVRYPKTLKHLGGGSHFGDSALTDVWFQSYPTNFADCVDAFGGTPHFGRIVYPRGDAGWEKYIADEQARDNFTAWADAGARANDYLAAFSDRQKPIGYVLMHPDSEFGRTYKWLVPRNFGVGTIVLVW